MGGPNALPLTPQSDSVNSWHAIATRVSERVGFEVSIHSVKRWAKRAEDPLPVRRWGTGRPRVVAEVAEIDRWADAQWVRP